MKKNLLCLGAAVLLFGMSAVTQAATLQLTKWTFGNGNGVDTSGPAYGGQGGGFSGTLTGAGALFDGNIETYCVELTQTIGLGSNYKHENYSVVAARDYFGDNNTKAETLGKLLSYANPGAANPGTQDDLSTALQLAIWNTVYDTDDTLSSLSGHFNDTSRFADTANDFLLGANAKDSTNDLDLWVLQSASNQDQLIWRRRSQVPEPASLALVLAALGGLGAVSRRRKTSGA